MRPIVRGAIVFVRLVKMLSCIAYHNRCSCQSQSFVENTPHWYLSLPGMYWAIVLTPSRLNESSLLACFEMGDNDTPTRIFPLSLGLIFWLLPCVVVLKHNSTQCWYLPWCHIDDGALDHNESSILWNHHNCRCKTPDQMPLSVLLCTMLIGGTRYCDRFDVE